MKTISRKAIKNAVRRAMRKIAAGCEGFAVEYAQIEGLEPFLIIQECEVNPGAVFECEICDIFEEMQANFLDMLHANNILITE